jgi:hypothetical protein
MHTILRTRSDGGVPGITFGITGVLGLSIVRYFKEHEVSETGSVSFFMWGWETPTLWGPFQVQQAKSKAFSRASMTVCFAGSGVSGSGAVSILK